MAAKTSGRGSPPCARQVGRERGGAGRVVRGVEQQLAAVRAAAARSSRPGHCGSRQAGGDRAEPARRCRARRACSSRRTRDRGVAIADGAPREADRVMRVERIARARRGSIGGAAARRRRSDRSAAARVRIAAVADDHRHARLDDAGLLDRDLAQRRAEVLLVIEGDRRDRGRPPGRHDVGGVEPAAEADFEHRHLDAGAAEQLERRPRSSPRRTSAATSSRRRRAGRRSTPRTSSTAATQRVAVRPAGRRSTNRSVRSTRCGDV